MERSPQKPKIELAVDTYLQAHGRSQAAVEHVVAVLTKYDHLVSLASERALDSLYVPDNVVVMYPRGWTSRFGNDAS